MTTGTILQVLSTFNATPLEAKLKSALSTGQIAQSVGFTSRAQMSDYMLAPASDTEHILGTLVLVRVEDWLRDRINPDGATIDAWARQALQERVRDFVNEITVLSYRGKPVWFLACPSSGWLSELHILSSLCRTYTNLLAARVRGLSQVSTLNWPASLSTSFDDRAADQQDNIPFTQEAFDRLSDFLAAQVARSLAQKDSTPARPVSGGSPELSAYLSGLQVQVQLKVADPSGRGAVDRIVRTAASFSLAGEQPDIADSEIQSLVDSGRCLEVLVSDRLGDHGTSGIVAYRLSGGALTVEAMSLSCTVLGKQVEYAVLSALAQMANEHSCSKLVFGYRHSGRNQPMLSFLQAIADPGEESNYTLPIESVNERIKAKAVNPGAWTVRFIELPRTGHPD